MAKTILVADDDPLTRRVLRHYLERAGYKVISADNGREAIERASRELPQLIILDMVLPDLDGRTVLRQLHETEATTAIPVILLSGSLDLLAKENQSGYTRLLAKPIHAKLLLGLVNGLISGALQDGTVGQARK